MSDRGILVISAEQIQAALQAREAQMVEVIKSAYLAHGAGSTVLPHSLFLRFPDNPDNRIIALPAYLDGRRKIAGLKWVSSFPQNIAKGLNRASAVLILNSLESGRPEAVLEGSIISAKRTAASAALAARCLNSGRPYESLGIIGCGYINHEICRFLATTCPGAGSVVLFDKDFEKAASVAEGYASVYQANRVTVARSLAEILEHCDLISFATTAACPYIDDLVLKPESTVLHVSLRDLGVRVVLSADNVVDDMDHVCRAQTSLHLAEQQTGNRDFVRCCLADILNGKAPSRSPGRTSIFSPFGLGILDLALGDLVLSLAEEKGWGLRIPSFLPNPWVDGCRTKDRAAADLQRDVAVLN